MKPQVYSRNQDSVLNKRIGKSCMQLIHQQITYMQRIINYKNATVLPLIIIAFHCHVNKLQIIIFLCIINSYI